MSTFKLQFHSPTFLNQNKFSVGEEKPQWHHIDGSDLEINVDDWVIHKIGKKGSCLLSKCEMDEDNYVIKFSDEVEEGNFKPIDYAFAVSMLGQILPKEELIHYLKQVQVTFNVNKEEKENKNNNVETSVKKEDNIE